MIACTARMARSLLSEAHTAPVEDTPPPCFPEDRIPPEATDRNSREVFSSGGAGGARRIEEVDEDGIVWTPDDAPEQRLITEESLLLDMRGLTSHPSGAPTKVCLKMRQQELWKKQTLNKHTVADHLEAGGMTDLAAKLRNCHSYYTIAICKDCHKVRKFPNRCDLFCCPECANHLQSERTRQVKWWSDRIPQPKHVILTIKNIHDLGPGHVDELRRMFGKLRRRKFAKNWIGGFYTIQVTKQNSGWHLHIHALINARWIEKSELSANWKSITNGLGYIVEVKDCRATEYLNRISRYIVSGTQLALWQPLDLKAFVEAFQHKRTFGVFGDLYGARTEFAEWIAELKQAKPRCDCGSCNVQYYSETEFILLDLQPTHINQPRPPPPNSTQIELLEFPRNWTA